MTSWVINGSKIKKLSVIFINAFMHAHKTLSISPHLVLSFSLSHLNSFSHSLLSKSCMFIWVLVKLLSRCLSLSFSLSLSLASLSLALSVSCGLWFVPNWNCLKATTQSPLHQAKQGGGTKPARERINQESRWRRVCAKLQTGAAQPRHQAIDRITIHSLCSHVKY